MWLTTLDRPLVPHDAALRLARQPGLAWLDGGLEHGREGRFSFVSTAPCERLTSTASEPAHKLLERIARVPRDQPNAVAGWSAEDVPHWVGHIAYDAASRREPGTEDRSRPPALSFARYDAWFAYDHERQCAALLGDDEDACARLCALLEAEPVPTAELAFRAGAVSVSPRADHTRAVQRALTLIREGELYEINLARRYHAPFEGCALGLFLRMRAASPVPLGCFVEGPG